MRVTQTEHSVMLLPFCNSYKELTTIGLVLNPFSAVILRVYQHVQSGEVVERGHAFSFRTAFCCRGVESFSQGSPSSQLLNSCTVSYSILSGQEDRVSRGKWVLTNAVNLHLFSSPHMAPGPQGQSSALRSLLAAFCKALKEPVRTICWVGGKATSIQLPAHRLDARESLKLREGRQQADLWTAICSPQPPRPLYQETA